MKKVCTLALACLFALAAPAEVFAEGFGLYEWSARGVALGGATMARKPDPSVIASNPAAITQLPGAQLQAGLSLVMPYGKMTFDEGGTYKVKDKTWTIPNFYYTQQVTDRLFLGVGEFSRFGLGFEYPSNWPGKYNIYEASVVTASVNPNVAYKLTDKLSVAVGVEVMYVDITLKKKVDGTQGIAPGAMDIDFNTGTENWEYAGNIAVHYQFNEQWAVGASYRTRLKHDIDGKLKVDRGHPLNPNIKDQDFTATVYMPDSASFGLAFAPTPRLSFEAGAVWTHWSRFTDLDFYFDDLGYQPNKKFWHNTWRLNFGVEYALTDWMDLRAGYVWDECPVPESREDYLIPTDNRNIWSVGVGFKPRNWTIDLTYAFVDPRERHYKGRDDGSGVKAGKTHDSGSHIVSMSVGYRF